MIVIHNDYVHAWMAEWSKAVDLSSILYGGVGSNPTPSRRHMIIWIFFFFHFLCYFFFIEQIEVSKKDSNKNKTKQNRQKTKFTSCGTRTRNPQIRSLVR